MKLSFYCGHYKKVISLIDEPDECTESGKIEVNESDWKAGNVMINCPECGAELFQEMDHFEVMK